MKDFLSLSQVSELKYVHRMEDKRRYADRIKALLMLNEGYGVSEVSKCLLIDEKSVRRYQELYLEDGVEGLCDDEYAGRVSKLSLEQEDELISELRSKIYSTTSAVISHVESHYGLKYSMSGMAVLLCRLGFSYKKPKVIPGKANKAAQEEFLDRLEELKEEKSALDPIYYMDGVHPQHNSVPSHGWLPKGEETGLKTNTGRERVNLNGALNAETHEIVVHESAKFNAETTLVLLMLLEKAHPKAENIYIICDNAGYYKGRVIQDFLKSSKVKLIYLPAYSPNLNLIERGWKFFKKKVLANQYYEKFPDFKKACLSFFEKDNWNSCRLELRTLFTDNFQIIGS